MEYKDEIDQITDYSFGSIDRDEKPLAELERVYPADINRRDRVFLLGDWKVLIPALFQKRENIDSAECHGQDCFEIDCPFCGEKHYHGLAPEVVLDGVSKVKSLCSAENGPDEYYIIQQRYGSDVLSEHVHRARDALTDDCGNLVEPLIPPEVEARTLRELGFPHW